MVKHAQEMPEDTKGVINQNPSIVEEQTVQCRKENGQTTIYKTLHRQLKIGQHELH